MNHLLASLLLVATISALWPVEPPRALAIELTMLLQRVEQMNEARAQRNRTDMRAEAKPAPAPAGAPDAATAKPREGKAPEDGELKGLLRRAIQLAADTAELDAVYSEIETRVGTDAGPYSGPGVSFGAAFGGVVAPNLVVYGTFFASSVSDPTATPDRRAHRDQSRFKPGNCLFRIKIRDEVG